MTTDMSKTTAPKSDQLNYDDFIAGSTKNITITKVDISDDPNADQPAKVYYQGDNGKPYKPCKSMRRVMVAVWGKESTNYVGRSMTLYGDPKVKWAGVEVGGIRISHMSHIDRPKQVSISLSKGKRAPYQVKPLHIEMQDPDPEPGDLFDDAKEAASNGEDAYKKYFLTLSDQDKLKLKESGEHEKLKDLATAVSNEPEY